MKLVKIISIATVITMVFVFVTGAVDDITVMNAWAGMNSSQFINKEKHSELKSMLDKPLEWEPDEIMVHEEDPHAVPDDVTTLPEAKVITKEGQPQGPWWDTYEEMIKDIEKIDSAYAAYRNIAMDLAHLVGVPTYQIFPFDNDKFKKGDNIGFFVYNQGSKVPDEWNKLKYSPTEVIGITGCLYMTAAAIASTILQKHINPAEITIAKRTLSARGFTSLSNAGYANPSSSHAFKQLWEDCGAVVEGGDLNGRIRMHANSWSEIDDCLANGGMVFMHVAPYLHGKSSPFTTSAHAFVVRDKIGEFYYVADSTSSDSASRRNRKYTRADLAASNNGYMLIHLNQGG